MKQAFNMADNDTLNYFLDKLYYKLITKYRLNDGLT